MAAGTKKHHVCTTPKRMPNPADVRALGRNYSQHIKTGIAQEHAKRMASANNK